MRLFSGKFNPTGDVKEGERKKKEGG